jgi:hypothetical protein
MGLVICRKHGRGFMFVCPHVVAAVRSSTACHGIQKIAYTTDDPELDIELGCWFCPECIQAKHLPQTNSVIPASDVDRFTDSTNQLYQPMCPGCFEEWRARGLA